jgi:hypothetical protein
MVIIAVKGFWALCDDIITVAIVKPLKEAYCVRTCTAVQQSYYNFDTKSYLILRYVKSHCVL